MSVSSDTIAAVSTATGRGGIGIVRISGSDAKRIATVITGQSLQPSQFVYTSFVDADGSAIDYGVALLFAGPASYTGEDVAELQGHGGPAVLELLLQRVLSLGARSAQPGEFTQRAFLNDKIDLAQAEAVSDLIDSASVNAAKAAVRSLGGVFSSQVHDLVEQLIDLRVYVEAALDFAEEEIDFLSSDELKSRATSLGDAFQSILASAQQGQLLKDGMTLVIAGAANVGKSSLLNCLTGMDSAIVTDIAGTTRDVLREHIHLDGLPVHILDTAGLRDSSDPVEQEGIRRARAEIAEADRVLWVIDASDAESAKVDLQLPDGVPVDRIFNKCDLVNLPASVTTAGEGSSDATDIYLSAKTGTGIDLLSQHLKQSVGYQQHTEGVFLARARHVEALKRGYTLTRSALSQLQQHNTPELAAEDLRRAQTALNEITGEFGSDDLLGRIFAGFCIGK